MGKQSKAPRRPAQFWSPLNNWWRQYLDENGRRPVTADVQAWYNAYADAVWGRDKPPWRDARIHAKCLRSTEQVKNYFRKYRASKKGVAESRSPDEDADDDEMQTGISSMIHAHNARVAEMTGSPPAGATSLGGADAHASGSGSFLRPSGSMHPATITTGLGLPAAWQPKTQALDNLALFKDATGAGLDAMRTGSGLLQSTGSGSMGEPPAPGPSPSMHTSPFAVAIHQTQRIAALQGAGSIHDLMRGGSLILPGTGGRASEAVGSPVSTSRSEAMSPAERRSSPSPHGPGLAMAAAGPPPEWATTPTGEPLAMPHEPQLPWPWGTQPPRLSGQAAPVPASARGPVTPAQAANAAAVAALAMAAALKSSAGSPRPTGPLETIEEAAVRDDGAHGGAEPWLRSSSDMGAATMAAYAGAAEAAWSEPAAASHRRRTLPDLQVSSRSYSRFRSVEASQPLQGGLDLMKQDEDSDLHASMSEQSTPRQRVPDGLRAASFPGPGSGRMAGRRHTVDVPDHVMHTSHARSAERRARMETEPVSWASAAMQVDEQQQQQHGDHLQQLPPPQRAAASMHHMHGRSYTPGRPWQQEGHPAPDFAGYGRNAERLPVWHQTPVPLARYHSPGTRSTQPYTPAARLPSLDYSAAGDEGTQYEASVPHLANLRSHSDIFPRSYHHTHTPPPYQPFQGYMHGAWAEQEFQQGPWTIGPDMSQEIVGESLQPSPADLNLNPWAHAAQAPAAPGSSTGARPPPRSALVQSGARQGMPASGGQGKDFAAGAGVGAQRRPSYLQQGQAAGEVDDAAEQEEYELMRVLASGDHDNMWASGHEVPPR
eukprot:CAMPEP_0202902302 /NCGR_PEP_ID=MMETSP1392-20130828/16776_1 /ASSEMBLY_ACC=CAM_ASM_000868 /TAXON_ID=225041 /ORGANISM="Chlamydomonas chlamydogama, Strain SAG 11-48b" /LENGTH=826 /DNA_ID=CAMNT_0049589049 /DNA_START=293 /DNA_END=2773 /DNA_ORIENTATION=-